MIIIIGIHAIKCDCSLELEKKTSKTEPVFFKQIF